jgi:hypothetical protein
LKKITLKQVKDGFKGSLIEIFKSLKNQKNKLAKNKNEYELKIVKFNQFKKKNIIINLFYLKKFKN